MALLLPDIVLPKVIVLQRSECKHHLQTISCVLCLLSQFQSIDFKTILYKNCSICMKKIVPSGLNSIKGLLSLC